jgi:hypothetical protein
MTRKTNQHELIAVSSHAMAIADRLAFDKCDQKTSRVIPPHALRISKITRARRSARKKFFAIQFASGKY